MANKSGNRRGTSPGSLEALNRALPRGYESRTVRISAPVTVSRWFAGLDAPTRGRVLEAAMRAGIDGREEAGAGNDWAD